MSASGGGDIIVFRSKASGKRGHGLVMVTPRALGEDRSRCGCSSGHLRVAPTDAYSRLMQAFRMPRDPSEVSQEWYIFWSSTLSNVPEYGTTLCSLHKCNPDDVYSPQQGFSFAMGTPRNSCTPHSGEPSIPYTVVVVTCLAAFSRMSVAFRASKQFFCIWNISGITIVVMCKRNEHLSERPPLNAKGSTHFLDVREANCILQQVWESIDNVCQ